MGNRGNANYRLYLRRIRKRRSVVGVQKGGEAAAFTWFATVVVGFWVAVGIHYVSMILGLAL